MTNHPNIEVSGSSPSEVIRQRVILKMVEASDARGLVVPPDSMGAVRYRGLGGHDYVCEYCGRLLAIGVDRGMFRGLVFGCHCGVLNQVG